jgi:hypothetical protein
MTDDLKMPAVVIPDSFSLTVRHENGGIQFELLDVGDPDTVRRSLKALLAGVSIEGFVVDSPEPTVLRMRGTGLDLLEQLLEGELALLEVWERRVR